MITPPQNNPPGSQRSSTSGDQNRAGEDIKQTARHLGEEARHLGDEARVQGKEQLEQLRGTAAQNLDKLAESAQAAASKLEEDDVGHLSEYVSDVASRMGQLSDTLRTKSIDEVFRDLGRIARENPALFVTGSLAIGFGISRFARASQRKALERDHGATAHETGGYSATISSGAGTTGARSQDSTSTRTSYDSGSTAGIPGGTSTSSAPATPTANPMDPASSQTPGTQGGIH
ncbi:MAG: hypothetical protein M3Q42_04575 [Pseudomonadota bacterium]|nr:hypothetical protein [Pseudomonadota bacterium]